MLVEVMLTRRTTLESLARALARPLARLDPPAPASAAVVLGAPTYPDGSLSRAAEERVLAGVHLYRLGLVPVVCFTGGPMGSGATEAEAVAMARRARAEGLPEAALRVEPAARRTRENALRTAELLLPEGRRRVWLVTQPFHTRRACHWFRRAGFEPLGWHIEDSLQYLDAGWTLRQVLREVAAWGRTLVEGALRG